MPELISILFLVFWGWMAVDCCCLNPKRSMTGGGWGAAIIFIPCIGALVYFFVHYLPRFTPKGKQEWLEAKLEAEIFQRKRIAEKNGITRQALLIAKQLGDRVKEGSREYENSELRIVADNNSVAISLRANDSVVFKARYTDTPVYEYQSGTSLEAREGGGYDVVHETGLGGGFAEEILGYIPGAWEEELIILTKKARAKSDAANLERREMERERNRQRFGL